MSAVNFVRDAALFQLVLEYARLAVDAVENRDVAWFVFAFAQDAVDFGRDEDGFRIYLRFPAP